jgi:hypothetical protein
MPREKVNKSAFFFPLLKLDTEKVHNAISAATSYINKDPGKLSKLQDWINGSLSTPLATAGDPGVAKRYADRIRSKILGHASVRQSEDYARVMNIELDKAMEIFNRPLVPCCYRKCVNVKIKE